MPSLTTDQQAAVEKFRRLRVGAAFMEQGTGKTRVAVELVNSNRDRLDRVAATIRHNRARGTHQVDAMSDLVLDLTRRNRSDSWIAKELGMDADEVLRLKQVSGLAALFEDREFSKAWEEA